MAPIEVPTTRSGLISGWAFIDMLSKTAVRVRPGHTVLTVILRCWNERMSTSGNVSINRTRFTPRTIESRWFSASTRVSRKL